MPARPPPRAVHARWLSLCSDMHESQCRHSCSGVLLLLLLLMLLLLLLLLCWAYQRWRERLLSWRKVRSYVGVSPHKVLLL